MTTCASCGDPFERKYERQRLCFSCAGQAIARAQTQRALAGKLANHPLNDGGARLLRALVRQGLPPSALLPAAGLIAALDERRDAA